MWRNCIRLMVKPKFAYNTLEELSRLRYEAEHNRFPRVFRGALVSEGTFSRLCAAVKSGTFKPKSTVLTITSGELLAVEEFVKLLREYIDTHPQEGQGYDV